MKRVLLEDEHRWFEESVSEFVDRELLPRRDADRREHSIDRQAWLRAGRQGFLGLGVPAEHGGSGVKDFRFNALFGESLVRAGVAYASSFGIHTDVVAPYLIDLTTDEQRKRWLPPFCTGELITAIGMTEPQAGSDLAALKTSARRSGGDWLLNGAKTFITNGTSADLIVVAARTATDSQGRGLSLFAVERGMDGFTRGQALDKVGQAEADTAELFFDDVRVPDDNLIGEVDRGFGYMMRHLSQERLSVACVCLAHAEVVLALTLDYVKSRRAFNRPIGAFQHSRFLLAEFSAEVDVARAFVDRCIGLHLDEELTAIDAAKAKLVTSDLQNRLIDGCVQLHGGYGYMREYDVARAWLDARVTRIWAGSNEIMREVIGRDLGLGE